VTRKDWAKIKKSAELFGLGEKATLAEIKKAYRRLSKKHHPDLRESSKQVAGQVEMHELTEAYQALLDYCSGFRFPLVPGENEQFDGDDWWFERFGQDHHWGKGKAPKENSEK